MVWARSPQRRCRERPKSVSLRCPVGRDTTWGPMDGVSPWTGCPQGWGVSKPVPPDSYLSHPGGCSPSETRQALGWPLHARGFRDPPDPILQPPGPTATHLHISVHDAQVVEVHWGEDGAVRAAGPLPAWCPLPPPWHPAGSCPPLGMADPACRSPSVGTVVAVPGMVGHSPSTSTSSAANRRTVASAKRPAARHSACRSPVLQ